MPGQRVKFRQFLDLVTKHRHPPGAIFGVGRENFQHIAPHPKGATGKGGIVAGILQLHQALHNIVAVNLVPDRNALRHFQVRFHRANTINARYRCHDDTIIALQNGTGGGMAHPVDLFVDRTVFFNIGVRARHIGFGLVIIVIGNEIFHRIFREEAFHLGIKLGGQRFIRGQHQGRTLGFGNNIGNGKCLARTRHPQQNLVAFALFDAVIKLGNRVGLVARRLIFRHQLKLPRSFDRRAAFGQKFRECAHQKPAFISDPSYKPD